MGGCSAHNGCLVVWGTPADYDEWAAATGDAAWGWEGMAPLLARAEPAIGTRRFGPERCGAFTRAALTAGRRWASPCWTTSTRSLRRVGAGLIPVNRRGRTRGAPRSPTSIRRAGGRTSAIVSDALADRVVVEGGRARAVVVQTAGRPAVIEADTIVLASGAYGSPAHPAAQRHRPGRQLRALGIDVVADLAGVGRASSTTPPCACG